MAFVFVDLCWALGVLACGINQDACRAAAEDAANLSDKGPPLPVRLGANPRRFTLLSKNHIWHTKLTKTLTVTGVYFNVRLTLTSQIRSNISSKPRWMMHHTCTFISSSQTQRIPTSTQERKTTSTMSQLSNSWFRGCLTRTSRKL